MMNQIEVITKQPTDVRTDPSFWRHTLPLSNYSFRRILSVNLNSVISSMSFFVSLRQPLQLSVKNVVVKRCSRERRPH